MTRKVIFCVPSLDGPTQSFLDAIEQSIGHVIEAGWEQGIVEERGCPYISNARSTMLRKALDAKADVIVFLDYDMSWQPDALLKLIETPGEVVSGAYRFKCEEEKYMGRLFEDERGRPIVREDGCVKAEWIPAGFLKITTGAIHKLMEAHPELCYGPRYSPSLDLFNHGAHEGTWWGEDYAFSRRWNALGGEIWVIPDLDITHHSSTEAFPGNYHRFLLKQPGGSKSANPEPPTGKLSLVKAA
jgi:glycosyltransferase involved in cell wall biosynthesis